MNVIIRVLREKIDMSSRGVVSLDLHLRGRPGAVAAEPVAQSHGEFVEVRAVLMFNSRLILPLSW